MTQSIHHAVEIGAGDRYSSQLFAIAQTTRIDRYQFVEPNMLLVTDLADAIRDSKVENVTIHGAAIGPRTGVADVINMGYASYVVGAPSFLNLSCEPEAETFWKPLVQAVPMMTMAQLEKDLPIDYLVLTCNGMEMVALSSMMSRPQVIRTKIYLHNPRHHEQWHQIIGWMEANKYVGHVLETNQHWTFIHAQWERSVP